MAPSPSIAYHNGKITRKQLTEMLESYQKDKDQNDTNYCMVSLEDIEYLIKYYRDPKNLDKKNAIDGFRIYFFRPDPINVPRHPEKSYLNVKGIGQLSIIIVPTHNFQFIPATDTKPLEITADNMFIKDDQCLVLTPGGETTGLCPNNCGGSQ